MVITLPRSVEDTLFSGIFAQPGLGVDIAASLARFDEVWADRVEVEYPGVLVLAADVATIRVDDETGGETAAVVRYIGESLFEDGEAWMVAEQPELCTSCGNILEAGRFDADLDQNLCSDCEAK